MKRCVGALASRASSTSVMMRDSVDSEEGLSMRMSTVPPTLMVPAKTASPGPFSAGSDSPVIADWSAAVWPDRT